MVEAEMRRVLLVNRFGAFVDKLGEAGVTDMASLTKLCLETHVADLEVSCEFLLCGSCIF